jgi:hypothetical protein
LVESFGIRADHEGVSATSPRPTQPRSTTVRAALLLTAAGIALAGCGRATQPVANQGPTATATAPVPDAGTSAEAAIPRGDNPPAPTGASQEPAATSAHGAEASPGVAPAAAPLAARPPLVAPVVVVPEDLAGIDQSLADFDIQLTNAGHDAATPEGDLG